MRLKVHSRSPALGSRYIFVFVGCGAILGISALIMSPVMPVGGMNETVASTLFAILFLWMIRAFAIGLAVATIRPIVAVFFVTRQLTHLTPREFFGTAFRLSFTLHLIAAEIWVVGYISRGKRR